MVKAKTRSKKVSKKTAVKKSQVAKSPTAQAAPKPQESSNVAQMKLPSVWDISKRSLDLLWRHRRLFLGIAGIYTILNIFLVRGFSGATDIAPLKDVFMGGYQGGIGQLTGSLTLFGLLITASGSDTSDVAAAYQTFLIIITSLAVVWALRQVMAGEQQVRVRDSFYKGMYPLVPVILIFLLAVLQLMPLIIGGGIYNLVVSNGIAVNLGERIAWSLIFFAGMVISLYFITSTVIALYIATLADMTPMRALRSARDLIRHRRWMVLRKILFLPLALIVISAVILLPIIWVLTPLAPWVFFVLSMIGIVVVHAYLYTLYRDLLA